MTLRSFDPSTSSGLRTQGDRADFPKGTVWLVGGGPGDPELLTRKAERLIGQASVVLFDALVSAEVLALASPVARLIDVGKRAGRHSMDQQAIGRRIVAAALAGERVVRLKGGDPAVFGRLAEELAACACAGVPTRICPGITAASAAAASLGASLTLRGSARRLTFVTAHTREGAAPALDWAGLADPRATLAIYMGKAAAEGIARGLIGAGLPGETPVALVENVSLPGERALRTTLSALPLLARTALGGGPTLILIGEALAAPPSAEPTPQAASLNERIAASS